MYVMEEDQDTTFHSFGDTITDPGIFPDATPPGDGTEAAAGEQAQNVYHIYVVKEPNREETETPVVDVTPAAPAPKKRPLLLVLVAVGVCLIATLSGIVAGAVFLTPSVTVTILPTQQTVTTIGKVTLVAGAPKAPGEIQGRRLASTTMSQQQTVKTTGIGHQAAQAAHGSVTFFNVAPYAQTIAAGTLLIASNGVEVVTDADVTIPAASLPLTGAVQVLAHATVVGPGGNIPARSINSACCRENIFARNNAAFTGGAVTRDFPMVMQSDLDTVAASLKTGLLHSIQAALQTQLRADETLVTPLDCNHLISPDHPAGSEAVQVTVVESLSCSPLAYDTAALQTYATQLQTQESVKQLGTGYMLTGQVQTTISKVAQAKPGLAALTVEAKSTWSYQFSPAQLRQVGAQLAGKSKPQATALLLRLRGVSQVSLPGSIDTLPSDPAKIHITVIYSAA